MIVRSKLVRGAGLLAALVVAASVLSGCIVGTGITGTVTADGSAHNGVMVEVLTTDEATVVRRTFTKADGSYTISDLDPGTYVVRVGGTSWYDGTGSATPSSAAIGVVVTANHLSTVSTDVALDSGGLKGMVMGFGGFEAGVTVDVVPAVDPQTVVATTTTDADGMFDFTRGTLPGGRYLVRISKAGYGTIWGPDAVAPELATVWTVSALDNVDSMISSFAGPESTLTATVTNGHTPIAGTTVAVYTTDDKLVTTAVAGADGKAVIHGLNQQGYHLLAVPPAPYRPAVLGSTTSDPFIGHSATVDLSGGDAAASLHVAACDPTAFPPDADVEDVDLTGTDLRGCDLSGSIFRRAVLTGADIDGADLSGARLVSITSGRVVGVPAALPSGWRHLGGYLVGSFALLPDVNAVDHASLASVDLSGMDLSFVVFSGSDLHDIDLSNALLTGDRLDHVNLHGANLRGATFAGGRGSSTTGIDLSGADLTGASFQGMDLTDADLTDTIVTGAQIYGVGGTPAHMDPSWRITDTGWLLAPGLDLSGLDASSADWTGGNLAGVDLHGTALSGAILTGANLRGANLRGTAVDLATFDGADLTDADLTGAVGSFFGIHPSFVGTIWSNTTCSDGSNSDDHGNTCEGYGDL